MSDTSFFSKLRETAAAIFWVCVFLLGLAIAGLWFVVAVGRSEERFECGGVYTLDGKDVNAQAFVRFERFKWPITMWADSGGMMKVEVPNEDSWPFVVSKSIGDLVSLTDFDNSLKGSFSLLSYALEVEFPMGENRFIGVCRRADE